MKYISLAMVRDHMYHIPDFSCPGGYTIRNFVKGDEPRWAEIEVLAGEFPDQELALQRFEKDFGSNLDQMEERCFFLEDRSGTAIGTATAWYGLLDGEVRGRVSWVGIVPAYQGRKLAKPLLSAVMNRMAKDHQKAYLTTQTTSYRAINLYLTFGFVPHFIHSSCEEGWSLVEHALNRTIL
jgi:ribosomal protein S18 acetylase RimI-like enzyme